MTTNTEAKSCVDAECVSGGETQPNTLNANLYSHQSRMLAFARLLPRAAWWVSMGGGKSRAALSLLESEGLKSLIVCPLTLINSVWLKEREKWAPGLKVYPLWHKTKADRIAAINEFKAAPSGIGIINYESLVIHIDQLLESGIQRLVLDESSRAKGSNTKTSKALFALSKSVKRVLLMSGNPAPQGVLDYYAQMRLIDDQLLGSSVWGFRNRWGYKSGYQGHEWKPYQEKLPELMSLISRYSIRIGKDDMPELPPQTFITREIELDAEQRALYDKLKKDKIAEFEGKEIVALNILSEINKLRQVSSGFVFGPDGEPLGIGRAKLDVLLDLLEEHGSEQVVIVSCWRPEIAQIGQVLGKKAGLVYGDVSEKAKTEAIEGFTKGDLQYLVIHPRSGGRGLNLQHATYMILSSLDYNADDHDQTISRIHRQGQARPCTYTYLIAKDTMDAKVLDCLHKKADVSAALLAMLSQKSNISEELRRMMR